MNLEIIKYSDKGIRSQNQDNFYVEQFKSNNAGLHSVIAVADGMGGAAAGDVASKIAVEKLELIVRKAIKSGKQISNNFSNFIHHSFEYINRKILEYVESNPECEGMGTTLTACFIFEDGNASFVNIGDSRGYVITSDRIMQITEDHDAISDAKRRGQEIDPTTAALYENALLLSLGDENYQPPDIFENILLDEDSEVLLCSDGFHKFVDETDIFNISNSNSTLNSSMKQLIRLCIGNDSNDNITLVMGRVTNSESSLKILHQSEINVKTKKSNIRNGSKGSSNRILKVFITIIALLIVITGVFIIKELYPSNLESENDSLMVFSSDSIASTDSALPPRENNLYLKKNGFNKDLNELLVEKGYPKFIESAKFELNFEDKKLIMFSENSSVKEYPLQISGDYEIIFRAATERRMVFDSIDNLQNSEDPSLFLKYYKKLVFIVKDIDSIDTIRFVGGGEFNSEPLRFPCIQTENKNIAELLTLFIPNKTEITLKP